MTAPCPDPPCPDREPMLHALLDGELDAANASALETHLQSCPACAQRLETLKALHERLAELPPTPAPEALKSRIEAMIGRGRQCGQALVQGLQHLQPLGAGEAGLQVRLQGRGVGRIELAVEQGVEHGLLVRAGRGHAGAPPIFVSRAAGLSAAISIPRARARRDITVPIGAPVISAIWR